MSEPVVLHLDSVTKRFGSFAANDNISITLHRGEVVALLGENGAGKTTLMNILFGHYVPDEGEVYINGSKIAQGKPKEAIAAGVGMVHQHFSLAKNLTVLENVMTGTEPLLGWKSDTAKGRQKLRALEQKFGLSVDADARVGDLSVGEQQRVEILKALYNDARILILDEPTGVLTQQEAEGLFQTLRVMAQDGLSIIFISHKLNEVMKGADRVVVLRAGKVIAERATSQTSKEELAELMVGRRVERPVREASTPGAVVVRARDVVLQAGAVTRLSGISFDIRAGETLGIVGVSGNGQAALCDLVAGVVPADSGAFEIDGQPVAQLTPRDLSGMNVGRTPEDRNTQGAVGELTLWENAVLERISDPRFSRQGFLRKAPARAYCQALIERFDVRGGTPNSRISLLSGGNMQKLILGRSLAQRPVFLLAAQPTRGLDEGAIAAIHEDILAARKGGTAVLLVSEDLDEVISLSDRIMAIHAGRLSPAVDAQGVDARQLGLMMAGEWGGMR
ncbi:ABC transporter ATP-binding protein (plasmid) [Tritonibacter mobilis]|uniref:ABC transporter ATP-binding protein n=1 Tax=Tritonibacter mobilis TaxID=379347 RepID=UPI000F6F4FDF|nr:ABC transporter ATP-binding protein [Tritonibacter mobilis]VCU62189.1 ABC transporter ATP-binding protein [Tritonibacter mobilis]